MRRGRTILAFLLGLLLGLACGFGIAHFHVVERVQQHFCSHAAWENGTCVSCGLACPHGTWTDGRCAVCGQACDHEWENAVCRICGQRCNHPAYDGGVCIQCGSACQHDFRDGVCVICGEECAHEWDGGTCVICGAACSHAHHDPESLRCAECGLEVPHSYFHGKCECGAEPVFYDGTLPAEFYAECEHPGTVEKRSYTQKLYYQGGEEVTKNLNVYLPYGYSEQQKYNVLVLIHGGGDNEDSWITKVYDFGFPLKMQNIYDNMIERKLCKPLIIVCPCTYNDPYGWNDSGIDQMATELRETILPFVAENYSTYAASGDLSDLQAAREHFGIGGMSNGAIYALNSGMMKNLDLFSNFICFSGNSLPYQVAEAINSEEWKDLPIPYFYAGAGFYDSQWQNTYYGFQIMVENTDKLTEGENAFYRDIDGGHNFGVWNVNMFNALQMVFPKTEP